eukprot:gene415-598_t
MYGDLSDYGILQLEASKDEGVTWNSVWVLYGAQTNSWQIATAAGEVRFLSLRTEAGADFVTIAGDRYSGNVAPPPVHFSGTVRMDFTSDAILSG